MIKAASHEFEDRNRHSLLVTEQDDDIMADIGDYRDRAVDNAMAKYERVYDKQMTRIFKSTELTEEEDTKLVEIKVDHLTAAKARLHERFDNVLQSDKIQKLLNELYELNGHIPEEMDTIEALHPVRIRTLPKLQELKKKVEEAAGPWNVATAGVQSRIAEKEKDVRAKADTLRVKLEKLSDLLDEPIHAMIAKLP